MGSFPGVTYISDVADGTALFQVLNPTPGTWTLFQEGMPPEQVTLVALSPSAAPETSFTSVSQQGDAVAVSTTVTPARSRVVRRRVVADLNIYLC